MTETKTIRSQRSPVPSNQSIRAAVMSSHIPVDVEIKLTPKRKVPPANAQVTSWEIPEDKGVTFTPKKIISVSNLSPAIKTASPENNVGNGMNQSMTACDGYISDDDLALQASLHLSLENAAADSQLKSENPSDDTLHGLIHPPSPPPLIDAACIAMSHLSVRLIKPSLISQFGTCGMATKDTVDELCEAAGRMDITGRAAAIPVTDMAKLDMLQTVDALQQQLNGIVEAQNFIVESQNAHLEDMKTNAGFQKQDGGSDISEFRITLQRRPRWRRDKQTSEQTYAVILFPTPAFAISGWSSPPSMYNDSVPMIKQVQEWCQMWRCVTRHTFDQGVIGRFYACHAERQLLAKWYSHPKRNKRTDFLCYVSRPPCDDCVRFFEKAKHHLKITVDIIWNKCIACRGWTDKHGNYCGCEDYGTCGEPFCEMKYEHVCMVCGGETGEHSNYCGCEDCGTCGQPFCGFACSYYNS